MFSDFIEVDAYCPQCGAQQMEMNVKSRTFFCSNNCEEGELCWSGKEWELNVSNE
jgi:endogenous inhibitor of DNA gyrase (YacG/DUF329 family)